MLPRPAYFSILDVAYRWHGLTVPRRLRGALPPVARITAAMLLRAIVDARLAIYQPPEQASAVDTRRSAALPMVEIEGTPTTLAEMSASGGYDPKVLAHYRLSMDELYVWAIGEGLDPPALCVPSWAHVQASLTRPRNSRKPVTARTTR